MSFDKNKHVRYWRMCSRSLPNHYLSNDASRMNLGFFIVSALDLLGALDQVDAHERRGWISWVYSCQVAEGGFRGFTGTDLANLRSKENQCWDPATLPATFFALITLLVLGDDLSGVKRQECLTWLPRLQRDDGSFGEQLSELGTIEGHQDLRQCCCAAGIAYMLQGRENPALSFNQHALLRYVQSCQSHEGGFGVSPVREPHSGLSYCAIATLAFLQRLGGIRAQQPIDYILQPDQCLRWLLHRQTDALDEEDGDGSDSNEDGQPNARDSQLGSASMEPRGLDVKTIARNRHTAGFNGRDGKIADTCYAFWNIGSLAILQNQSIVDEEGIKRYLLEVTQHQIGGFGKGRGDPPDVLHSYLGLAALGLFGQSEIKVLDPTMCVSVHVVQRLESVSWKVNKG